MNENKTLTSTQGSSLNGTENATITNSQLIERTEHVSALIRLMQSRLTLLTGKLMEENEATRSMTEMDVTKVNKNCKTKLVDLWTAIKEVQFQAAGLRAVIFSTTAHDFLSKQRQQQIDVGYPQQVFIPGIGGFTENICALGVQLANVSEQLKNCCQFKENELHKFTEKQHNVIELITDVVQEVEKVADTYKLHEAQSKRNKERDAKTKIATSIINYLLSEQDIDFEEHPDLLDLKMKWRPQ